MRFSQNLSENDLAGLASVAASTTPKDNEEDFTVLTFTADDIPLSVYIRSMLWLIVSRVISGTAATLYLAGSGLLGISGRVQLRYLKILSDHLSKLPKRKRMKFISITRKKRKGSKH